MFNTKPNVALINIDGIIIGGKGKKSLLGSTIGADIINKELHDIAINDKYRGVIIRVNSPGGSSAASQEIYELIEEVRNSNKYVISSMADIAASGGYMISSACDTIIASPSTLTGSIGVILSLPVYKAMAEKLGYSRNIIKAGQYKDIGNPLREMTQEEYGFMQNIATECHKEFIELVAKGRHMSIDEVTPLATGMVFTGRQAYNNGLVDELGNFFTAIDMMKKELAVDDINIKEIKMGKGFFSSLLSVTGLIDAIKSEGPIPKMSL